VPFLRIGTGLRSPFASITWIRFDGRRLLAFLSVRFTELPWSSNYKNKLTVTRSNVTYVVVRCLA
jgi:hypothetical protein